MARKVNIAVAATGVLLVAASAVVKWVLAPALVKVPLDISSTTIAEGRSQVFVVSEQAVKSVDVVATRVVRGDKGAGTGKVAVFDETLCLVAKATKTDKSGCAPLTDPGFIQKTTDRVAFDRKSGLAVSSAKFKAAVDGDTSAKHAGLDYTFAIDTRKKNYQVFDPTALRAFPAVYRGTEHLHGLTVYKFVQQVPASPIKIQSIIPGRYSGTTTFWVEPTTGVIVKGSQRILEQFASNGNTVFDGTLTFTDRTVREQANFADSQLTKIHLIRWWIPLGLVVLGLVGIVVGVLRGRIGRSRAS